MSFLHQKCFLEGCFHLVLELAALNIVVLVLELVVAIEEGRACPRTARDLLLRLLALVLLVTGPLQKEI